MKVDIPRAVLVLQAAIGRGETSKGTEQKDTVSEEIDGPTAEGEESIPPSRLQCDSLGQPDGFRDHGVEGKHVTSHHP